MDCKTVSKLMMEYLDGELSSSKEKALFEHLKACECCSMEFQALKETLFMLEEVEMEDAPENLEQMVISSLKSEKHTKPVMGKLIYLIAALLLTLGGWITLTFSVLYTPVVNVFIGCIDVFSYGFTKTAGFVMSILSQGMVLTAKLLVLSKALLVVVESVIDMYSILIMAMILSMLIILKLYGFMFKSVRR